MSTTANAAQPQPIYTTPSGFEVREFSHSQWTTYNECPKQYEILKLRGWKTKKTAQMQLGTIGQEPIRLFFEEQRDPVETFEQLWEPIKQEEIAYPEGEDWESFRRSGVELMRTFSRDWKNYPPRRPGFFDWKRNKLRIRDQATMLDYATVPDLIDKDEQGSYIADIKFAAQLIDTSTPGIVTTDMQLRTQAAATGVFRVALWNFCRKPKRISAADREEILVECHGDPALSIWVVRETNALTIDAAGELLKIENPKLFNDNFKREKKLSPELAQEADRIIASVKDRHKPQYVIQWAAADMPREHALAAVREQMSVIPLIQQGYFPRVGGVRFPNNTCPRCPARGLCMEELFGKRPEYDEITKTELVAWDERAMEDLD